MNCPRCGVELHIKSGRYEAEGDDRPDAKTRVFLVQELTCVNRNYLQSAAPARILAGRWKR
jgi:hypothetical protein